MGLAHVFGPEADWPSQDLVALSEEIDPDLTEAAYASGVFPMPIHDADWPEGAMGWWSPINRGILPLGDVRVTRSLRKSAAHYRVTVDRAFDEVMRRCADPSREGGWIDDDIVTTYRALHERGVAHSVECWRGDRLAGGLYGVSLGGLFAGESMFHDPVIGRDASKVALLGLVAILASDGVERLLDVQWVTPHLASLGAVEVDRVDYLRLLDEALELPPPDWGAHA